MANYNDLVVGQEYNFEISELGKKKSRGMFKGRHKILEDGTLRKYIQMKEGMAYLSYIQLEYYVITPVNKSVTILLNI